MGSHIIFFISSEYILDIYFLYFFIFCVGTQKWITTLETQKQTYFNKKIQPNLKWKKIIITQLLHNIKKVTSIYFPFIVW